MGGPLPPELVTNAPVQEAVLTGFDITRLLPALFHAPGDAGRYITAGIVVVKDLVAGVYNASYHRLQLLDPDRVAIKLDFGRHLRASFERAKALGKSLPVVVRIGADLALQFTAATMRLADAGKRRRTGRRGRFSRQAADGDQGSVTGVARTVGK